MPARWRPQPLLGSLYPRPRAELRLALYSLRARARKVRDRVGHRHQKPKSAAYSDRYSKPLTAIHAGAYPFPPDAVGKIPHDSLAQPGLKSFLRPPAQFAFDLAGVDGVAHIVAGPICDEGDQLFARAGCI